MTTKADTQDLIKTDGPFMTFKEAATYLPGLTELALKKLLEREAGEFADGLRDCLFVASKKRRWLKRSKFLSFIKSKSH